MCPGKKCGQNAIPYATSANCYCKCYSGYYGNPGINGGCEQDLGNTRFIIPLTITIPVVFTDELNSDSSDNSKRFRYYIEISAYNAIRSILPDAYNMSIIGVQWQNFK